MQMDLQNKERAQVYLVFSRAGIKNLHVKTKTCEKTKIRLSTNLHT
jgi:hypothetical protein